MARKKKNITLFHDHLAARYGKKGTSSRVDFEVKAKAFLKKEIGGEGRSIVKTA